MYKFVTAALILLILNGCSKGQPEVQQTHYDPDAEAKAIEKMRERDAAREADNARLNRESAENAKKNAEQPGDKNASTSASH